MRGGHCHVAEIMWPCQKGMIGIVRALWPGTIAVLCFAHLSAAAFDPTKTAAQVFAPQIDLVTPTQLDRQVTRTQTPPERNRSATQYQARMSNNCRGPLYFLLSKGYCSKLFCGVFQPLVIASKANMAGAFHHVR